MRDLVTGGTGFIGRHLVARLAESGENVRVAARGERKADLPQGVEQVRADVVSGEGLAQAMAGVDKVVEPGRRHHGEGLAALRCGDPRRNGGHRRRGGARGRASKLVYVSAIGAAPDPKFPYWHAKWQAEQSVTASRLDYTVLRPSLLFGPEDDFFNRLARLVRRAPVVPVAGNGKTRFQPIWVEDVVSCVVASLGEGTHDRETLEIGGPEYFSYDEIIDLIGEALGIAKRKIHLPLWLMRPTARVMQSVLPNPPVTTDQLAMLSKDNTTALDAVPKAFGFQPRSLREGLAEQLSG